MRFNGRSLAVVAAGIVALGAPGCGGGGGDEEPAAQAAQQQGGEGQERFASTCGGCHTLGAAGTRGTVGPNLDELEPDRARVLDAIRTGPGQMPANLISGAEAEAVADFVAMSAGG